MGSHAPSSSSTSPEVERERIAPMLRLRELPMPLRYCSMTDVTRRSGDRSPARRAQHETGYAAAVCDTCGSGDRDDELLLCDRCDRGRYTFCLLPIAAMVPIGPWFCPDCAGPPVKRFKSFPMEEAKIIDFFRIQNDEQDGEPAKCRLSQVDSMNPYNEAALTL
ncbi:histone-lysine N-methyltransferase ATXR5-like [Panicum virgatum]|uniref:histone-lysine N-methyltransferase ATXR5-like n=1 Tax=Panicum virgatum TaxID=38727 RepID=UPI0019D4FE83|nr:histone-lysine N-methyltransferase ATXR5-like [Panicum virgatum]